jgi:energy-converting hydrogenase B subunit D
MILVIGALGALMTAGAIAVLFQRSLRNAALTFGAVSLLSALMFALMRAYDVAITEASIGAVLTTALFFWALRRIEEERGDEKE